MNMLISFKKFFIIILLSTMVIIVPNISHAHEQGYYNERLDHHYNKKHVRKSYKHSKHKQVHKQKQVNKHNKKYNYNASKHHHYDHGHVYPAKQYYIPGHTTALHRKGLFIYLYN